MNEKRDGNERRRLLREQAEALVETFAPSKSAVQTTEILMHELMVHKVELEMQNEELNRSNISLEESRDRYVNLYEFSPVGYITLSGDGLVNEINLSGSVMLGIERFRIISRRFSNYVALNDRDRWHLSFMNIMQHAETIKQAIDLHINRADGTLFYAYLTCVKIPVSEYSSELRITLTDISELKQAKE